jgi:hypothetical protein
VTALVSANDLDLNGHKVINLAAPTAASNDAARKIDVESASTDDRNRTNHTGTQLASTISNFDTQVRTSRLDQMAAPTAAVSMNSQKITNLAAPTAGSTDAARAVDIDNAVASLTSGQTLKGSVRVVTSTNVNLAAPGASLDGVAMSNGDVFLAAGQTTGSQNGPYVFNGAASAATRATNWDSAGEAVVGSYWIVREGTQADKFALLTNDTFTLNTTTGAFTYVGATAGSDNDTGYAANVGTGSAGPYSVVHSLNSTDITVQLRELAGNSFKLVYWKVVDANTISVEPDETWASNSHRVVVSKVV